MMGADLFSAHRTQGAVMTASSLLGYMIYGGVMGRFYGIVGTRNATGEVVPAARIG